MNRGFYPYTCGLYKDLCPSCQNQIDIQSGKTDFFNDIPKGITKSVRSITHSETRKGCICTPENCECDCHIAIGGLKGVCESCANGEPFCTIKSSTKRGCGKQGLGHNCGYCKVCKDYYLCPSCRNQSPQTKPTYQNGDKNGATRKETPTHMRDKTADTSLSQPSMVDARGDRETRKSTDTLSSNTESVECRDTSESVERFEYIRKEVRKQAIEDVFKELDKPEWELCCCGIYRGTLVNDCKYCVIKKKLMGEEK